MGRKKDEKEAVVRAGKKVYAICEGLTEKIYLEHFQRCNRSIGHFEINVFEKISFEQSQSDRMRMVDMLTGMIDLMTKGRYTPYMYVTSYLHSC